MAKKKLTKHKGERRESTAPDKRFKAPREEKLNVHSDKRQKKKVSPGTLFNELRGVLTQKDYAKSLGISERTLRSYHKYFAGESLGKNDRKPPEKIIKKLSVTAKKFNSGKLKPKKDYRRKNMIGDMVTIKTPDKVDIFKEVGIFKIRSKNILIDQLITRDKRKAVGAEIAALGKKYSYTIIRIYVRFYMKGGAVIDKHVSVSTKETRQSEIFQQLVDYINSILMPYTVKAEILNITVAVIGRL